MTEKEREEDNRKHRDPVKEKRKLNYMQRLHKIGGYNMDRADDDPKWAILK